MASLPYLPGRRYSTASLISQLYQLAKTGSISWSIYKQMKGKPAAVQKAAINKATGSSGRQPKVAKLAKQVKSIQFQLKNDFATHVNRVIEQGSFLCANNVQFANELSITNSASLQNSFDLLRYYDPATPGTLVTAAGETGTFSRQMTVKNINFKVRLRNNYQSPCNLTYYICEAKADTGDSPLQTWRNGTVNQYITDPNDTAIYTYPTDSVQMKEVWKVIKTVTKLIQPGSQCEVNVNTGKFVFDPSLFDDETDVFQRRNKATVVLFKIWGPPSHSGTSNGTIACGLDFTSCRTTSIQYDAGTSLQDYSHSDNFEIQSTAVVSNKPVADNQIFTSS